MKIAEAMNTYNPALKILTVRGYSLEVLLNEEGDEIFRWVAKKNNDIFYGITPLSLLALCIIGEEFGEEWRKQNKEDIYGELLNQLD